MKLLKYFFAILAASVALQARAQYINGYQVTTIIAGGTNNIAAGSAGVAATNTYTNIVMSTARSEYIALGATWNYHAAPVGVSPTLVFRIQRSLDGSNWEGVTSSILNQTGTHNFGATPGTTNNCVAITNFVAGSVPYFRIVAVENTNSAVVTNLTFFYGVKR